MSGSPQTGQGVQVAAPARRSTVIMGRQDFVSVLFRAINAELYKIRRRMMSKVLAIIGILFIIAGFVILSFTVASQAAAIAQKPATEFLPLSCIQASKQSCATQADLAKQAALQSATAPLHLPNSFVNAVGMINFIGLFLLVTLAGTIVGGEYHVGTIRLMLTKGPTRTQFLLAKAGAILACIAITFLVLVPTGIITGTVLMFIQAPGIAINFSFLTGMWVLHALLYLLAAILGLFVYTMIALCLSTLGKATVAGVAGTIVWWIVEGALADALGLLASLGRGPLNDFLKAIPDYFIGNNIATLLSNQSRYLEGGQPTTASDLHALLVLFFYLIVFIGLAWWVSERRDITN
ncbi:MAG TPA: ABC transporter permease subunit [Ktedonobacteraceae bacterium]|nr:ABC transporter permease subunit [Ktedonobacteraceae bacterium]